MMVPARAVRVRMAYPEPSSGGVGRCLTEKWSEICLAKKLSRKRHACEGVPLQRWLSECWKALCERWGLREERNERIRQPQPRI